MGETTEIDAAEWEMRVNLAAAFRLVDLYGWSDLLGTHLSARVPGNDQHFLINPFGVMFDEMTASALVKVDLDDGWDKSSVMIVYSESRASLIVDSFSLQQE